MNPELRAVTAPLSSSDKFVSYRDKNVGLRAAMLQ